jgi:hypothetical protein
MLAPDDGQSTGRKIMKVLAMTAVLVALAAPAFAGDMPQPMNASDIQWGPVPPVIPPGAELAVEIDVSSVAS